MKWYRIPMCFDSLWKTLFLARSRAPFESDLIKNGRSKSNLRFSSIWAVQIACCKDSVRAMYSDSVEESATVRCFRVAHAIDPSPIWKTKPVVDRRVSGSDAQSASHHPTSSEPVLPS